MNLNKKRMMNKKWKIVKNGIIRKKKNLKNSLKLIKKPMSKQKMKKRKRWKKRKKNELELEARVLITAGHRDVDQDVFLAIHNNGLVYNGRLIVDKNF